MAKKRRNKDNKLQRTAAKAPVNQSPDNNQPQKTVTTIQQTGFHGPLPPPEIFKGYNSIVPGAAERILANFEAESNHRRSIETKIIDSDARETLLGQVFALTIGVVAIVTGGVAAIFGAEIAGAFIGTGGVVGLVSVFIYGRSGTNNTKE